MYIPSFKQLSQCVRLDAENKTICTPDEVLGRLLGKHRAIESIDLGPTCQIIIGLPEFAQVLERAIGADYVDEDWYRRQNPDVGKAIASKMFPSARLHFCLHGYFENRAPRVFQVDEEWYLAKYPDIEAAVRKKAVPSGAAHYQSPGFSEGRIPGPGSEADGIGWNEVIARFSRNLPQSGQSAGSASFGQEKAVRAVRR